MAPAKARGCRVEDAAIKIPGAALRVAQAEVKVADVAREQVERVDIT